MLPLAESQSKKNNKNQIPKIIHFIWAGGERLLPPENIENIDKWAKDNPDFDIYLWVDEQTAPKDVSLYEAYHEIFSKYDIDVFPPDATNLLENQGKPRIILKDITCEGVATPEVRYEIDKLRPNYGASSDLIRYYVLWKYGGCMFDCGDVLPGKMSLSKSGIFDEIKGLLYPETIYIEFFSQEPDIKEFPSKEKFASKKIGNDSWICSKESKLMKKILDEAIFNYNYNNPPLMFGQIQFAYSPTELYTTVERTGPVLVRWVLMEDTQNPISFDQDLELFTKTLENQKIYVHPLRTEDYQLCQPKHNTLQWLFQPLNCNMDPILALEKIIKTIQFEIEHLHVIRLDDHIRDFSLILQGNRGEAVKAILDRLNQEKLVYSKVNVAQYLFENPLIKKFYEKHEMSDKYYSDLSHDFFSNTIFYLSDYHFFKDVSQRHSDVTFNKAFGKSCIKEMHINIIRTVEFIKNTFENSNKPSIENLNACVDTLYIYDSMCNNKFFNDDLLYQTIFDLWCKIKKMINSLKESQNQLIQASSHKTK